MAIDKVTNLATLLDLPLPGESGIQDQAVAGEYDEFIKQLKLCSEGRVILSNPYFFYSSVEGLVDSYTNWFESLSTQELDRYLLLSVLTRPMELEGIWDDTLRFIEMPIIKELFTDQEPTALTERAIGIPYGRHTVAGRRRVQSDYGLRQMLEKLPDKAPIAIMNGEFIGNMPGNYSYQSWQVTHWNEEWCGVFSMDDGGCDEGYPFPLLLGFCRSEDLERNFIRFLYEGCCHYDIGFYNTYGKVYGTWLTACFALRVEDDYESPRWNLINWLVTLDKEKFHDILLPYADKDLLALIPRLEVLVDEILPQADMEDLSAAELFAQLGREKTLAQVEVELMGRCPDYFEEELKIIDSKGEYQPYTKRLRCDRFRPPWADEWFCV